MLYDAGYAGLHWPVDAGGRGATPTQHLIFLEETERAGAPYVGANFVGLLHAGPTIAAEGTAEQRARWLPPVLRGDEIWCQGFSEPDAGLRPRGAAHPRGARRRPLRGQRSEDLDLARGGRRLVRTARAHRPGRARSTAASPGSRCRWTPRASPSARCARSPGPPSSPRCSSTRCGCRSPTGSARRTTAGGSPWSRCPSSAARPSSARSSPAAASWATWPREARANGRWDDPVLRRRLGRLNAEFRALWRLTQWNVSEAQRAGGTVVCPAPAARSSSCATRTPARSCTTRRPRCSAPDGARSRTGSGSWTGCPRSRTRSPRAPRRSSRTSSPSGSSACRRGG